MRKGSRAVCMMLIFALLCTTAFAKYETLEKGDSGADVQVMQLALSALGYDITPDGKYGADTMNIVRQFQKDQKLTADGKAGNNTLTRLYQLMPQFGQMSAGSAASGSSGSASGNSSSGNMAARVQTTGGTLTLRKSQSTSSAALQYIPNLTILTIQEKGSKWCKTTYGGKTGYVLTSYLSFLSGTQPTATVKPAATAKPTATPKPSVTTAQVKTTGGTLTLRKTQSTAATALALIPNLTILPITARGTTWCQTAYDGKSGYVLTKYLNFGAVETTKAPTATPAATRMPDTAGSDSALVKTTGGTLTLRKTQSTSASGLKYIPNGTRITILEKGSKWCKAEYAGKTGYVLTSYLVFDQQPAQEQETFTGQSGVAQVKTSGGTLTLRQTASTAGKALLSIKNGTILAVSDRGTTWSRVVYGGYSGYVQSKYLDFDFEADPPASVPTASPTKTPTVTPPPYDTDVFTRTLRSGSVGQDVTKLQQRLKELNYLSGVSGTYDAGTVSAVKLFQKLHGLTQDGVAGVNTFTMLFSDGAIAYSTSLNDFQNLHIYYRDTNQASPEAVLRLQNALRDLGYAVSATGQFDENTHNAVVQFQMRNGLTPDGCAGATTQMKLYSGSAKGMSATPSVVLSAADGKMDAPPLSQIQLLHWYNVVKPSLASGSKLLIFDPQSNLSWTLRLYAKGHHADSEPLTLKDTLIMNKAFGKTNWTIHPVYVKLPDGRWTMATMHNRPHLTGSISGNGFDGHLCVHFLRDMDECRKNDPSFGVNNQTTLRTAWKKLTGETVD